MILPRHFQRKSTPKARSQLPSTVKKDSAGQDSRHCWEAQHRRAGGLSSWASRAITLLASCGCSPCSGPLGDLSGFRSWPLQWRPPSSCLRWSPFHSNPQHLRGAPSKPQVAAPWPPVWTRMSPHFHKESRSPCPPQGCPS